MRHKIACTKGSGGKLDEDRAANTQDIGPDVKEIPLNDLFEKYLPSLRYGHTPEAVVALLKRNGILVGLNNILTGFETEPCKNGANEDAIFASLELIVNAISDAAIVRFDCSASCNWMCNPTRTPVAASRTTSCRPDAYLLAPAVLDRKKVPWENVAIPAEFKKDLAPDDITKVPR